MSVQSQGSDGVQNIKQVHIVTQVMIKNRTAEKMILGVYADRVDAVMHIVKYAEKYGLETEVDGLDGNPQVTTDNHKMVIESRDVQTEFNGGDR